MLSFTQAKRRSGKIAIKWIATAVLGSAGVATVSYNASNKPESSQTAALQADTKDPVDGESTRSALQMTVQESAVFGSNDLPTASRPLPSPPKKKVAAAQPMPAAAPPPKPQASMGGETVGSVPSTGASTTGAREDFDSLGRRWVRVYFATDRTRLDLNGPWIYTRMWAPVALGVLLASILAIGIVAGLRRVIACAGTAVAVIMTAYFAQQAVIGTQAVRLLAKSSDIAFGTTRYTQRPNEYPLHLGVSEVTLPPNHKIGELERPSLLRLEWKEDDKKHVVLQRVEVLEPDDFFRDVQAKGRDSALVFIHGFNVRFDDALRRTAQLTADLDYRGIPVLYSWPSKGKTLAYTYDESNVGWTVPHLEEFLLDLKTKANVEHIHVVAHSMGNRALLGVVERFGLQGVGSPVLSRVVMAAPDVDSQEFQNRFSGLLQRVAVATTVYGSKNDRALQLSESIHGYDRLGLVSDQFGSHDNVDMIDTSPLDLSLLGHSYYGENPLVMDDIKAFLSVQTSARSRPWLRVDAAAAPNRVVWRFAPSAASGATDRK
ncbi:MAG: alpha/beta hydrolase [Pirellula sp.]